MAGTISRHKHNWKYVESNQTSCATKHWTKHWNSSRSHCVLNETLAWTAFSLYMYSTAVRLNSAKNPLVIISRDYTTKYWLTGGKTTFYLPMFMGAGTIFRLGEQKLVKKTVNTSYVRIEYLIHWVMWLWDTNTDKLQPAQIDDWRVTTWIVTHFSTPSSPRSPRLPMYAMSPKILKKYRKNWGSRMYYLLPQ